MTEFIIKRNFREQFWFVLNTQSGTVLQSRMYETLADAQNGIADVKAQVARAAVKNATKEVSIRRDETDPF